MGYVSFLDLYSGASKLPLRIFFCFRILQFFFPKQIPGLFVTIPRVVFCGGGNKKVLLDACKACMWTRRLIEILPKGLNLCHDSRLKISCQFFMFNSFSSWEQRNSFRCFRIRGVSWFLAVFILKHAHTHTHT